MSLTEQVLKRISDAKGKDPSDLQQPLYEVIDPDALEIIFESYEGGPTRNAGRIQFEYLGYEVTVPAEGDVSVRELD